MISAQDELNKFLDRKGIVFADALLNCARAKTEGRISHDHAIDDLARLIRNTLILTDLHGRRRTLIEADRAVEMAGRFSDIPHDPNPIGALPFTEAIEDLMTREPRLAQSAEEVSRLYNTEHVFALARSADMKITERVQKEVETLVAEGKSSYDVENAIIEIGQSADMGAVRDWTRAYAGTVYRTNAATGFSNGRFEQAQDKEVKAVIPAFEYSALMDDRTRPNHAAANGLIADTLDPVWHTHRPPQGYNCRCAADFISKYELERRGLWKNGRVVRYLPPSFSQARPDPGFKSGRVAF